MQHSHSCTEYQILPCKCKYLYLRSGVLVPFLMVCCRNYSDFEADCLYLTVGVKDTWLRIANLLPTLSFREELCIGSEYNN